MHFVACLCVFVIHISYLTRSSFFSRFIPPGYLKSSLLYFLCCLCIQYKDVNQLIRSGTDTLEMEL